MIKHFLFASAFLIAACGRTDTPAAPDAPAPTLTAPQAAPESGTRTPEVGDRIPDRSGETASTDAGDTSIASASLAEPKQSYAGFTEIGWEDLMPPGEEERLAQIYQQQMASLYSSSPVAEGSAADKMVQIGTFNTVKALNETKVRIPGYTVPFEYGSNAEISEFLLVPYYGACIHAPPPPPNQTIFVIADDPIKLRDLAQAVWINGTIYTQTQESELADAAYTIKVDSVEIYEY